MPRTGGQKAKARARRLVGKYEKGQAGKPGGISPEEFEREMGQMLAEAGVNIEKGRYGLGTKIRGVFEKGGYYDPSAPAGTEAGEGPATDEADPLLEYLPEKWMQDIVTGKGGENLLAAMSLSAGLTGRDEAVGTMEDALRAFQEDPLTAALGEQAMGLMETPLYGEGDIAKAVAAQDARLSQAGQAGMAGLQHALGGRGIDPGSGIAAELAAGLQFNTLQQGALGAQGIRERATLMNRQALQDAMQLGLGTAQFQQGMGAQLSSNLANAQSFNPLGSIIPQTLGLATANNLGGLGGVDREGNRLGGALTGAMQGASAGTAISPGWGTVIGAVLGGAKGYFLDQ